MGTESKENRKAFDPTVNFSFFGSWIKSLEAIEKASGTESAYSFFKAIANYSMYDEQPDFSNNPMLYAIWAVVEREIDISIGKRKRNFANDEKDNNTQKVIDAIVKNPDASLRDIEKLTGVAKSTVDRIKRGHKEQIENALMSASDSDSDSDSASDSDNDYDNDTMGRDRDGTVGQHENDELSVLDKIGKRLSNPNILRMEFYESGEHLGRAMSVRGKWRLTYQAWQRSITNEAVESILNAYLSLHEESEELKRLGDKYGRIIDGWDGEKQEPKIVYSVTGYFPQCTRHNITDIPIDYYMTSDDMLDIEAEKEFIAECAKDNTYDDMWDGDMPF